MSFEHSRFDHVVHLLFSWTSAWDHPSAFEIRWLGSCWHLYGTLHMCALWLLSNENLNLNHLSQFYLDYLSLKNLLIVSCLIMVMSDQLWLLVDCLRSPDSAFPPIQSQIALHFLEMEILNQSQWVSALSLIRHYHDLGFLRNLSFLNPMTWSWSISQYRRAAFKRPCQSLLICSWTHEQRAIWWSLCLLVNILHLNSYW